MIAHLVRFEPGIGSWLVLAAFLFATGLYGILVRRNAVGILIAVELCLNAAAMNFVIFNRFVAPTRVDGQVMSVFLIATAAAEVVVGIAIFVTLFRERKTVDVVQMNRMQQ